ncbi:uncharacterized protein BDW43DRAFT_59675 [Aspergillus alliaceus]|uniref:uncharacterized protein n=1 Tax=Petromyces alliaceus TaxID=209559 RepID=UPI0012A6BBEE|nr:uncharacterized protein BDW43DRAFT_59675 [Aspergillus alliaceus]KAB8234336.1 hypothetical protein BDW43DRAFT_59675 [Aspergillus alliaceus]
MLGSYTAMVPASRLYGVLLARELELESPQYNKTKLASWHFLTSIPDRRKGKIFRRTAENRPGLLLDLPSLIHYLIPFSNNMTCFGRRDMKSSFFSFTSWGLGGGLFFYSWIFF